MKKKTITLTQLKDVQVGDSVSLRKQGVTVNGKNRQCVSGGAHVELPNDRRTMAPPVACTDRGWEFVGGTREVVVYEPGETGTALVNGRRVPGTWCEGIKGMYFAQHRAVIDGIRVDPSVLLTPDRVTSFVPASQGITRTQVLRAMSNTRAAEDNGLESYELRELYDTIIEAVDETDNK